MIHLITKTQLVKQVTSKQNWHGKYYQKSNTYDENNEEKYKSFSKMEVEKRIFFLVLSHSNNLYTDLFVGITCYILIYQIIQWSKYYYIKSPAKKEIFYIRWDGRSINIKVR